jgi:hypothetical protein
LHEKQLSNEAEIARLEEELARLKGDDVLRASGTKKPAPPATGATAAPNAASKPGT